MIDTIIQSYYFGEIFSNWNGHQRSLDFIEQWTRYDILSFTVTVYVLSIKDVGDRDDVIDHVTQKLDVIIELLRKQTGAYVLIVTVCSRQIGL